MKKTKSFLLLSIIFLLYSSSNSNDSITKDTNKIVSIKASSPKLSLGDFPYYISIPEKYRTFVLTKCIELKIPLKYYVRAIQIESNWKPNTVSNNYKDGIISSTDIGIGQLNSKYIEEFQWKYFKLKEVFNPYNGIHSIEVSTNYISDLYSHLGNWRLTFMSYNCGLSAVRKNKIPKSTLIYASKIIY